MAKIKKSCSVQNIRFKTKRGRQVEFRGRSAGQEKNDGKCGNKARHWSPEAKSMRRVIAKAGKYCIGTKGHKIGTKTATSCLKTYVREHRAA